MRFPILLGLLYSPNPFGVYRTPIDYQPGTQATLTFLLKTGISIQARGGGSCSPCSKNYVIFQAKIDKSNNESAVKVIKNESFQYSYV